MEKSIEELRLEEIIRVVNESTDSLIGISHNSNVTISKGEIIRHNRKIYEISSGMFDVELLKDL